MTLGGEGGGVSPALFLGGGVLKRKRWTEQRYHKFVNSQRLNYADVCCPSARDRDCLVFLETRERKRDRVGDTGRRQRQGERGGGCRDRGMEAEKVTRGQDMEIKGRRDREGTQRERQGRRGIKSRWERSRRGEGMAAGTARAGPGADKGAAARPGGRAGTKAGPGGGGSDGDGRGGRGRTTSPSSPRCGPRPAPLAPRERLAGPQGRGGRRRGWRAGGFLRAPGAPAGAAGRAGERGAG